MSAATFTLAGIAAAFGVASCCALPLLLASIGLSAAWLSGIALIADPYRDPLLILSALCLFLGGALLLRQQLAAGRCAPRSQRLLTLVGLIVGAALLWAGYHYV